MCPLLQSTGLALPSLTWIGKSATHWKQTENHSETWQRTTEEIIRGIDLAVICFCEVGEVSNPLEAEHLDELQNLTRLGGARCGAGTEHVEFLQTKEQPYLTAYRKDRVTCSRYCMLSDVYAARGLERTAQHFLATTADTGAEEGTNVINVHAPSGTLKLTDAQRNELITNLLQSKSRSMLGQAI